MAQPQEYQREYDFTERDGDDTNHAEINAELDGAALSINQIRDNLALIQRDDGALANGIVTAAALATGLYDEITEFVSANVQDLSDEAQQAAVQATLAATTSNNARDQTLIYRNETESFKNAAAANATSAAASAEEAQDALDLFNVPYLGPKSSPPTEQNDGSPLTGGELYFDTTLSTLRVFNGLEWENAPGSEIQTIKTYKYTASAGQTDFSGPDDNGSILRYTVPGILAVLNGSVLTKVVDYGATDGLSLSLSTGALIGDVLEVYAFENLSMPNIQAALEQYLDGEKNLYVGGVDYTIGVSTGLTLPVVPARAGSVKIYFDGQYQNSNSWSLLGAQLTFSEPISANEVEVTFEIPSRYVGDISNAALFYISDDSTGVTVVAGQELIISDPGPGPYPSVTLEIV